MINIKLCLSIFLENWNFQLTGTSFTPFEDNAPQIESCYMPDCVPDDLIGLNRSNGFDMVCETMG